jgi:preprotein translocase subunit SecF
MSFCPKCGASLTLGRATAPPSAETGSAPYRRYEKTEEKSEKHEKHEKQEKYEKREYSFIGPLVGGLILLFIGLSLYLAAVHISTTTLWAFFFILIGLLVIIGGVYGTIMSRRRHPRT